MTLDRTEGEPFVQSRKRGDIEQNLVRSKHSGTRVPERDRTARRRTMPIEELAKVLGLSRSGTYKGLRDGSIPVAARIGRRFIISRASVDAWLQTLGNKTSIP